MDEYDLELLSETPDCNMKEIELKEGNNKYKCKIELKNKYLKISVYNNTIKYEGKINISNIEYNLGIFNCSINEIFDEIYTLDNNKFNLIKDNDLNKYILKIEFSIFKKKRYLNVDLYEKINNNDNIDYINKIKDLEEKIKEKDNTIKLLEEELNKYKLQNNHDPYDNFDIKEKKPKYINKNHKDKIWCSTVLKDGRFATGSADSSIIIYNNKTFKPDLIFKEHEAGVTCLIQLSSGYLASCSNDNKIKLYNIIENQYNVIQTLKEHTNYVTKIIELKNKQLVSCSDDKSIIFYNKDNKYEYKKDFSFSTNGPIDTLIQTKDNEICYYEESKTIYFYDYIKKNIINKINNISVSAYTPDCLLMISEDLLLIIGKNKISILNVNLYQSIKIIDVPDSGWINSACMLNKDMILTADDKKRIMQWKIENENLTFISQKENAHDDEIYTLTKLGNGLVLSGSGDNSVKIW